jgi:hypothetical protein
MSEKSEMTCAELADVAAELALGVLTGRERAMAVAHLDTCDACREDVRQLMTTGERLLELLPPAEPPAGFETRVLARLGLPAPSREPGPPQEPAQPRKAARHGNGPRHRGPAHGGTRPAGEQPSGGRHSGNRHSGDRHGEARRPRRLRRALAAAAMGLALVAAGFGGWRIGAGVSPPPAGPLTSARLLSAAHRGVGSIYLYSGASRWLYMSVDLGSGDGAVTCQLVGAHGQVITLGSFWLANGYGTWGSPAPGNVTGLSGARLVSAAGTVLATATFTPR